MIYILLADGFEDIEALAPLDILRRAKIDVKTVGIADYYVTSAHEVTVKADILIEDIKREDMQMLVLPGGAGHKNLDESEAVQELIDYAGDNEIYIAAICASPSVIGKKGLLSGKNYTCFPGFSEYVTDGIYSEEKVVLDGKFLTAKGAGAASDFGFKMVEIFSGRALAEKIRATMQY